MTKNRTIRAKRGRPEHQPTAATRKKVAQAVATGSRLQDVALALRITVPTLYKHYLTEMTIGALDKRALVIDAMFKAAMKGNVSACKAILALDLTVVAPSAADEGRDESPAAPAAPKLGKKDQANIDAKTAAAGTDWADLLPEGVTPIRGAG